MALARIISSSQACSRELALDLLARGYAVEIVSPNSIPDNLADLELRVEEDPGNQLVASVKANGNHGEHSASLDFVHHLRAPMADLIRRPSSAPESVSVREEVSSFRPEPLIEDVAMVAETPCLESEVAAPALERLRDPEEDLRLVSPALALPEPLPLPSSRPVAEVPTYFTVADLPVVRPAFAESKPVRPALRTAPIRSGRRRRDGFAGWRWRAALTFASVLVLAAVVGFGLRRTGKAAAQDSEVVQAQNPEISSSAALFQTLATQANSSSAALAQAAKPSTAGPLVAEHSTVKPSNVKPLVVKSAKVKPSNVKSPPVKTAAGTSRRHRDDLIAPNTVTYLDKSFAPVTSAKANAKPKPKSEPSKRNVARRHPRSHKHSGEVVAANKITILDKPASKSAKQDSASKRQPN